MSEDGRSTFRKLVATVGAWIGPAVAVLAALIGLAAVAFFILMAIALQNFGSNK